MVEAEESRRIKEDNGYSHLKEAIEEILRLVSEKEESKIITNKKEITIGRIAAHDDHILLSRVNIHHSPK